jgi:acyl dehydratase
VPSVLTDYQAGHTFPSIKVTIDAERALAYRASTGDALALYDEAGVIPPLAVAAIALGVVLDSVALTPGSLHGSESLKISAPVPVGSEVELRSILAQRSRRSGWIASVLQTEMLVGGDLVATQRATVLSPEA